MLFLFKTWFYDRWPVVNQSIIYQFNAIALNSRSIIPVLGQTLELAEHIFLADAVLVKSNFQSAGVN